MRSHDCMQNSSRAIRGYDHGDANLSKSLDGRGDRTPLEMLRDFASNTDQVKESLNKHYRNAFFREVRGGSSSSRRDHSIGRGLESGSRSSRYGRDDRDRDRRDDRRDDRDREEPRDRDSRDRDARKDDRYSSRRDDRD